ncbi:hypothetical protein C8F01DRAFT_1360624 [Mycena amicta]|nr:hypothetical protein C8F01DRAFT_1360624 [Mycena amicta]
MDAALELARTRLSEVEKEIQRFEAQLAILRNERTEIRQRLDEYTYPVLTLPNEITTEIFVHYLPPYPDHPPLIGLGSPTHLLGICRLWRSIALHSPALWRSMELGDERPGISEQHLEIVQNWLQRSGSTPLSLHLVLFFSGSPQDIPARHSLFQTVLAHRSRWEYFYFHAPAAQISLISGPSPRLVRMTLIQEENVNTISLHNTPLLRSVSLWNVGYPSSLSWDQLTSLSLRNTTFVDSAPILQMAVNLLRCKLFFRGTGEGIQVRMPRLEALSFLSLSSHDDRNLEKSGIDAFTLPSLRTLAIGEDLLGGCAVKRLESLISRSGCQLERLRIVSGRLQHASNLVVTVRACRQAFPPLDVDALYNWQLSSQWEADPIVDSSADGANSEDSEDSD